MPLNKNKFITLIAFIDDRKISHILGRLVTKKEN